MTRYVRIRAVAGGTGPTLIWANVGNDEYNNATVSVPNRIKAVDDFTIDKSLDQDSAEATIAARVSPVAFANLDRDVFVEWNDQTGSVVAWYMWQDEGWRKNAPQAS